MKIKDYVNLIISNRITVEMVVRQYYTNNIKSYSNGVNICECPFHTIKRNRSTLSFSPRRDLFFFQCFNCGKKGDTLDFVSEYCKVSKADAGKMICQDFGININDKDKIKITPRPKIKREFVEKDIILDLTPFILDAYSKNNSLDYFHKKRNISKRVINKYRLCNVNPENLLDKKYLPKLDMGKYSNILPIWYKQKVISIICRRIDDNKNAPKYANLKSIPMYIFNQMKLLATNVKDIYICESILDSLSIESLGGHGISLNSTSNKQYLIDYCKCNYKLIKDKRFILCGDEDEAGEKMNQFLSDNLKQMKVKYEIFKVDGDVNEMHVKNNLKLI